MKIGFDGKRAVNNNTGLGNYSRLVVDVLSAYYPANEYVLYVPEIKDNPRMKPLTERNNVRLCEPDSSIGRVLGSAWRSFGVTSQIKRDGIDLFHGLSNELPLNISSSGITSVVTIHDVIFRRVPENYKAADRLIYDFKFRRACKDATRIIAVSERTKSDIVNDYGIDPAKVDVIYQGCHPQFGYPQDFETKQEVREKYNLPERYYISVGTVETRKNQLLALKALRALPSDVKMVIVGRRTDYAKQLDQFISSNRLSDRVIFLENVPFVELPALYSMACFATYTSRYEGFGIPIVEALSAGVPVVACTGSCLEEAGGTGAIYINPDDTDAMTDAALKLLEDGYLRDKMVESGRRHIKSFTNAEFARRTIASYNKAIVSSIF
ncbi:MAG: glycosyltransferase family 4 protein [Muribaculaceae bacterium]|nr:glycosyltransferase family 4 protein [Muribaculaceae bacterium]